SSASRLSPQGRETNPRSSSWRPAQILLWRRTGRPGPLRDSTPDHLAKNRLHVCLCKRSQGLCANVSKSATAQTKSGDGYIIWCLDNCDDVVLSQCPEYVLHGRSALFRHVFEGVRPFR